MKYSLCGLLILLMLSACVQPGPDKKPASDKLIYGAMPAEYEAIIMSYLNNTLKDPDSIKNFAIQEPRKGSVWGGMFNGFKREARWYVCFTYNAKNSYGGYTGQKEYIMWFSHGKPKHIPPNPAVGTTAGDSSTWDEYYC